MRECEEDFAQRLLKWVLRLYPKGYRHELGPEMAGTYVAATANAGRGEVLREAFDLAGHGLRVRLGLTSDRYAGAVLAAAVPYVLGSIAGLSGYMLYQLLGGRINAHYELFCIVPGFHTYTTSIVGDYAPLSVLVAAAVLVSSALAGRRSWIRWSAGATVVTAAATIAVVFESRRGAHIYVLTTFPGFEMPLMLAVFALMVLAVPVDAAGFTEQRVQTVGSALAVAALLHLAWVREGFAWSLITMAPGVVAAILILALAVGVGRRDAVIPGAAALACAPWLVQSLTGDLYDYGFTGTQYVLLVWFTIVLIFAVAGTHYRRLSRSTNQ